MTLRSLLIPLTPLYRLALDHRQRRFASGSEPIRRLRFPVVSIGNLSTGGAGKTPLTIALAQALTQRGFQVDVLSRGYGRLSRNPARVDPSGSAGQYGDEPLLIAQSAQVPVYVAPQRYDAGLLAEDASSHSDVLKGHGFSRAEMGQKETGALAPEGALRSAECPAVHILDDGYQHRQLHRDIDILLLNRADWHDRLLPAGNLREPLAALRRAGVIAIPATEPDLEAGIRAWGWQGPVWRLHRKMYVASTRDPAPVVAFCGIARPDRFFAGLEFAGVHLTARRTFTDHHRFTARDLAQLTALARKTGASALITTDKDAVRLRGLPAPLPILTATLRIEIEDQPAALDWLAARLAVLGPAHPV